jgi:hypothetical protein
MKLRQLTRLHLLGILLAALVVTALLLPGMGMAQAAVTVQLDPVGASEVSGTATLTAAGEGTDVTLDVVGLAPNMDARATMNANTCAAPSASFAALPALKADATGGATATGSVLFRGTEAVALETMADGEHVIAVQAGQVVACGVIPKLASAAVPSTLPATGGAAFPLTAAIAGTLGFCTLSVGAFMRLRSQTRNL